MILLSIKKVLGLLFLIIASGYSFEAGVNLMTYPSDLTFIGGLVILVLLVFFWVELGVITINHVIQHFKGEK